MAGFINWAGKTLSQETTNALGTVSDTGQKIFSGANKAIDNIARNPLPVIETAALMWVLGPEALALDLEPATIAAISNATVSAANGGNVEKIALNFAVAYMGSQAGKAIGSTVSPIEGKTLEQLGPQYSDTALLKQIVTSSSGAAAATALKGGSLNAILTSGISAELIVLWQIRLKHRELQALIINCWQMQLRQLLGQF